MASDEDDQGQILHQPVLLKEVLEHLITDKKGIYIDATTGTGGHSYGILSELEREGRLLSLDRDEHALSIAGRRCNDKRQQIIHGEFSMLKTLIERLNIPQVHGVLFDLGLSMLQLRDMQRGFSFTSSNRLDMRMNRQQALSAWDIVNRYTEGKIEEIIRIYGEEGHSRRIAKAVVDYRRKRAINTCAELAEIVSSVIPFRGRIHPATKTFQALRIAVNDEIKELKAGLQDSIDLLKIGGRVCVISYHSLEDREVKNHFRSCQGEGSLKILTKKPLVPSAEEMISNKASRSAKLRVGERV